MVMLHSAVSAFPSLHHLCHAPNAAFPLLGESVQAGFPSPADDWLEDAIDLNQHFIKNPPATFLMRVCGDSMRDVGILHGDIVAVDRSLQAKPGRIVVASIHGEFTIKRLSRIKGKLCLVAENPQFAPIELTEELEAVTVGVVVSVLRSL